MWLFTNKKRRERKALKRALKAVRIMHAKNKLFYRAYKSHEEIEAAKRKLYTEY